MSKYTDLFKLCPQPEEVITMDEAIVSQQEEIVSNYIITTNLEQSFDTVFHHLTLDKGKGFWIQGAYGSGKSHFMSYLTILLKYDQYWDKVPEEFQEEYRDIIREKNFLTVNFTLSEVNDLRAKIFDEIESSLKKDGHTAYIKNDKKIVRQFLDNEYNLINRKKFYEILEEGCQVNPKTWEKVLADNDISQLADIIIKYKQVTGAFSQKEYREIIYPSIKDGIQQIMEEVEKYYDGLVIFIDELSEFLQKKKAKGEEAEALETIQALGQRIKKAPIWVLAAVQKNPAEIIDETLYVSDEEEKVFDRFEPIILSQADIEEIIDKRLIIKSENNKKSISYIYQDLAKRIPQLAEHITQERFIRLYPFHHSFVSALIHLSSFGARQRVAIRECWNIANKHLNNYADQLITIDMLYDIFKDTILHDYFKEYYDLYENLYSDIISRPDFKSDPDLARSLIKALIINSIYSKKPLNSIELAHWLMVDMGLGMELSLIYDVVYDTLMEIYEKSRGKGINVQETGENIIENLWEIDPGSSGVKIEPEIIAEVKLLNENDLARMVQDLINTNQHLFANYTVYWNTVHQMDISFNWRNTERYGITTMKNLLKLDNLPDVDPVKGDIDFGLITGFPLFGEQEEKIMRCKKLVEKNPRFIFWIPQNIDQETEQKLKQLVATKRLLDKYSNPKDDEAGAKKLQLETKYNSLKDELSKIIEKSYFYGVMVAYNKVEKDLSQFNNLTTLINYLINYPLDELYPKHPRYSKEVNRRQTNKLIKDFIIPRISKQLTNEIENVAIPFDIVEERRGRYELKLNNEIFKDVINLINDGEWHGLDQVYENIRLAPWGLQKTGLELIIAALISNGECKGQTKDGEIINSEKFSRNLVSGKHISNMIVSISKGSLVNSTVWSEILKIMDILNIDYVDKKTSLNQDKIWADLMKRSLELKNKLSSTYQFLLELGSDLKQYEDFVSKLVEVKKFIVFLEEIEALQHQDSYEGLENLRTIVLDKFTKINMFKEKFLVINDLLALAEERVDVKLKANYNYFKQINSDLEEVKEVLNGFSQLTNIIVKPNEVRDFISKLEGAKESYQKQYIKVHREYYKDYQDYLNEVFDLKEYQTLVLLEKIEKIKINPTLNERLRFVQNNYHSCHLDLMIDDLKERSLCACGLNIDEEFIPIDLEKIKEEMCSGIKEYINALKSGSYRRQIELYFEKHRDSKLNKLLTVEAYDLEGIIELVDEELIMEINKAFKAAYPVEVDVKEILKLFKGSIHASEVTTLGQRISSYLMKQVKEVIEGQEDISIGQIVIFFKNDTETSINQEKIRIAGIELNRQEHDLYSILQSREVVKEDDLIEEMELKGYKGLLPKGLVVKLNNKYANKYGVNLIEIEEKEQTYYSLSKEEGVGNA
jgi:hypothetical protein